MIRQKGKTVLITGVIAFLLCACGQNSNIEETSLKFEKDGTVVNTIVEDFDETLYNADDLKGMVLSEVAAFNTSAGADSISVDKIATDDGKVTLSMTYAGAGEYAEFNNTILFSGTVSEAYEAGLNFDISLTSTQKDGGKIGKEDILQMGDSRMIILEEPVIVITSSPILYTSDNVEVLSGKRVKVTGEGAAYLILKQK